MVQNSLNSHPKSLFAATQSNRSPAHTSTKLKKTLAILRSNSVLGFVQGLLHSAPIHQALQLHIVVWPGRMCSAMQLELSTDLKFSALKTDFLVI